MFRRGDMDETQASLLARNDPALEPLLTARDETARRRALEALIESLRPLVHVIMQRFRRTDPIAEHDAEDLAASITLSIVVRLRLAATSAEHAIEKLDGYVATLTYNALYDFRRRRNPERTRLKNKLRYLVTTDKRFASWPSDEDLLCGLAGWSALTEAAETAAVRDATATPAMRDPNRPAESLAAILKAIGRPVLLDRLVRIVADIWHIREPEPVSESESGHTPPSQLTDLESKEYLRALWTEIRSLPPRQRQALLLNLRDSHGSNALVLFLLLEIVSVDELAAAVSMSADELTRIWDSLPLDDQSISERLGMTRQQVINLRKAARARLNRRAGEWS